MQNKVRFLAPLLLTLLSSLNLVWASDIFKMALPGYSFQFPADHASHPNYKTEWWYYTGHLKTDSGKTYGYELTFFRSGAGLKHPPTTSAWRLQDIYATHFAISDEDHQKFYMAEKLNRNHVGAAHAETDFYKIWNENWSAKLSTNPAQPNTHQLSASTNQFKIALDLTPEKPVVIHGKNGVSQKADCTGCASHYYSLTRLATTGTLWINGKPERVRGLSWMDHEFGSNQLTATQTGWDWFSIQLDNQTELMLYVLRNEKKDKSGKPLQYLDPNSSGTLVYANGTTEHLSLGDFKIKALKRWVSPNTKAVYPMGWNIQIPKKNIHLTITPTFKNQELVTQQSTQVAYWEGSSQVKGTVNNKPVVGLAYVEMTGYAEKFRQKI